MRWLVLALIGGIVMSDPFGFEQPEDAQPVTVSPQRLVDTWGDDRFLDTEEPAEVEVAAVSAGPAFSTMLTHGLVNADWRSGPPEPDAPITDANQLPGWTFVSEQGSIRARRVTSATSKSGYAIRWEMDDPANSDRAYLQQVVEVAPGDQWLHFRSYIDAEATSFGAPNKGLRDAFASVQFYDATGATTGSETIISADGASHTTLTLGFSDDSAFAGGFVAVPTTARYVAFRHGVRATGADSGGTTDETREVYLRKPDVVYATFAATLATTAFTGTGTTALYLVSAGSDGTPAQAAERFIPYKTGYVVGISVRLSSARTGGTLVFQARNEGASTTVGPTATINGTDTQSASGWAPIGTTQAWDFEALIDPLRVIATGTGFTPTAADALVHVTVAMFDLD